MDQSEPVITITEDEARECLEAMERANRLAWFGSAPVEMAEFVTYQAPLYTTRLSNCSNS
jgi:hypothetical protein